MNKIKLNSRSGFTLLEILLVVVIIGFLVSVAVVKLSGSSAKAKTVATQNQIDSFKTALGVYELDNGVFPSTEQGLQALLTQPSGAALPNWKGPYLDPPVIRLDPWGRAYTYKYPGVKLPNGYDLYSTGPSGVDGNEDNIGNWQ